MIFLTAAVVGSMESRKTGLIINIASDFGRLPAPLVALYGATKAFVVHFSKCIRYEYAPSNIHVQCVCPMFVCTKMSKVKRPSFLIPTPEKFVQHALCSATRLKVSFDIVTLIVINLFRSVLAILVMRFKVLWLIYFQIQFWVILFSTARRNFAKRLLEKNKYSCMIFMHYYLLSLL